MLNTRFHFLSKQSTVLANSPTARKLKDAGFSDQQAEIQAQALAEIVDERLATKQDIIELRRDMQRDIQDLEYRLTIRLGTMLAIAITAVATLVKLL